MQKHSPRKRKNIPAEQEDSNAAHLRSLRKFYDYFCPGERERLYLAAEDHNVEPLVSALRASSIGSKTLWQIIAEALAADVSTPEEVEQRQQRSRALQARPRKKRQSRARKRSYDERVRTTKREVMRLWSAARAKLTREDRLDPATLQQLADSLLARYLTRPVVYKQTAAQQAKKQIDKQIQRLSPANM